jgi:hypothetical protein
MTSTRIKNAYTSEQLAYALKCRDFLSLKQVAQLMGKAEGSIRAAAAAGESWVPPMFKQGTRWVCLTSAYKAFLQEISDNHIGTRTRQPLKNSGGEA